MKTNAAKPLRVLAILSSLTMFAGYVVYAQLKQGQSVAPSSKVMVLEGIQSPKGPAKSLRTNIVAEPRGKAVAPGAKVKDPALHFNPKGLPLRSNTPPDFDPILLPGSKSAAVFDLHKLKLELGTVAQTTPFATNPPSSKP
ncbi:MAG TPA: hypothetical protein VN578_11850 [Candidatus Binatia bacterium]|jgi:hypothetical protein|nr:hypothetical protein [Candidatus Binatia bacterium]